jgi:ABC-type polysaccharide/polyol phosphate transport system ATPase subunit
VVIEARDVHKTFRIPSHRINSFKERAVRPFAQPEYRELHALRGISLDVHKGEFFGVVGRNGSGKSTLLKVMASIYRADAGRIRMAGRLAPFIELGVGFNTDLTARENVVLNGVMMGLSRREARNRLDAVLEFAELEDFVELPLKNYSSGMLVRLAFAVMVQADADIMLVDEVLAVGDASFAQKCADTFRGMRDAGKTIVLVTHDMATVEEYCDRALLINEGEAAFLGAPDQVSRRYLRLNFDPEMTEFERDMDGQSGDEDALVVRTWLEDASGVSVTNLEHGDPIQFRAEIEGVREVPHPSFGFMIRDANGTNVAGFGTHLGSDEEKADRLVAGERVILAASVENPLTPGRYTIDLWVCRNRSVNDVVVAVRRSVEFVVFGSVWTPGIVALKAEIEALPKSDMGPPPVPMSAPEQS